MLMISSKAKAQLSAAIKENGNCVVVCRMREKEKEKKIL
jgi:hypothetical protein